MTSSTNSDSILRRYRETVGMEAAEALAAQGQTDEERTQTDTTLIYRERVSDLARAVGRRIVSRRTAMESISGPPNYVVHAWHPDVLHDLRHDLRQSSDTEKEV